jgi:hypothetical protein
VPRIDDLNHLGRRDLLAVCWRFIPQFFSLLSPSAQSDLHRFYGPSLELTDEQVLARIKHAGQQDPSLRNRAGKYYKVIFDRYKHYADQVGKENFNVIRFLLTHDLPHLTRDPIKPVETGRRKRQVSVQVLMRPEIDVKKFSRALLALAEQLAEEARKSDAAS